MRTFRRWWEAWWFGPISPVPLGLFRLCFGLLVLAYGALLFPDRRMWFSERGAVTTAMADRYNDFYGAAPTLNLLHGVADERQLSVFFCVFCGAALMLALGFCTRLSAVLVFVGLASLHNRDNIIHNSGDTVMMVMSAYLVLAPAGAALSLDRLWRRWRKRDRSAPPLIVPWAQRLMQIQVAAVYASTSLSKLTGERWRDGTAAYYPLRLPDSARFPVPWVDGHHLWLIHALTWGTLVVELSLWTLVWVPRLRLWVLAAGTLLHLGIEYSLNIPLFSFLMITSYLVFLTGDDVLNFRRWLGRAGRVRQAAPLRGRIQPSP